MLQAPPLGAGLAGTEEAEVERSTLGAGLAGTGESDEVELLTLGAGFAGVEEPDEVEILTLEAGLGEKLLTLGADLAEKLLTLGTDRAGTEEPDEADPLATSIEELGGLRTLGSVVTLVDEPDTLLMLLVSTLAVAASGVKECDAPLVMFGAVATHVEVLVVLMTLVVAVTDVVGVYKVAFCLKVS